MTAPADWPECPVCGDTGWATCVDLDGESAYEMACPEGCPIVVQLPHEETEVPF